MNPEMIAMTLVDEIQMDVSLPENGRVWIYGVGQSFRHHEVVPRPVGVSQEAFPHIPAISMSA